MDARSVECNGMSLRGILSIAALMIAIFAMMLALPRKAAAGYFELSSGFSFNKSNYGDGNYEWTRRWGATFGYHLSDRSEIEFCFQDVVDRAKISGFEDTTLHDDIYSVDWVQALSSKDFPIQPYLKLGIGQLNRDASGTYFGGGSSPPIVLDQVIAVLGAGLRIYLTRTFALRGEATSYLTGPRLSTWQDNVSVTGGVSIFF